MEALLQDYYKREMKELSFIIINERDSLSKLLINELEERVSFPVYQDNAKEDIWSLLRGGKDDMYIYDRCGRLTFYIPFPLSIIHPQQPIVNAAIHATYYENLCSEPCLIPEMDKVIPSDYQESLDHKYVEENVTNTTDTLDVEDIKRLFHEENDMNINNSTVIRDDGEDEFSFLLELNGSTSIDNETNLIGNATEESDIFNDTIIIFNVFNETISDELLENMTDFTDINYTVLNTTDIPENTTMQIHTTKREESFWDMAFNLFSSNKTSKEKSQAAAAAEEETETDTKEAIKGRCNDPSYEYMCIKWGKKKLWHAYLCCNSDPNNHKIHRHCVHYKAKRCKKLHPMLKCCLGTAAIPTESSLIHGTTNDIEHFATVG